MRDIKKSKLFFILSLFIILSIYLFFLTLNKGSKRILKNQANDVDKIKNFEGRTIFNNVEYKNFTIDNRLYITQATEAYFLNTDPDKIYLKEVYSYTNLKDGTLLKIYSNRADYYKKNKDITYFGDVLIENKIQKITSEIAKYEATKKTIELRDKIVFSDEKTIINGDIAIYNLKTNQAEIFMKSKNKQVHGKKNK